MANSVEKTMQTLRALSDSRGKAVTLSDLSAKTGINKSTLSHIIKVLCQDGYVSRVSHREGYTVGPELFFLTRYGRFGEEITSSCHSILEYLSRETGGTAIFSVLNKGKKYIIDYVEGDISYRDSGASILSDDLYRTVTGRKLLSVLPVDEAIEVFRQNGLPESGIWDEVKDEQGYLSELERIKDIDVLVNYTSYKDDRLFSCATLIYKGERAVAALGFAMLSKGTDEKHISALIGKCKHEAERRLKFT